MVPQVLDPLNYDDYWGPDSLLPATSATWEPSQPPGLQKAAEGCRRISLRTSLSWWTLTTAATGPLTAGGPSQPQRQDLSQLVDPHNPCSRTFLNKQQVDPNNPCVRTSLSWWTLTTPEPGPLSQPLCQNLHQHMLLTNPNNRVLEHITQLDFPTDVHFTTCKFLSTFQLAISIHSYLTRHAVNAYPPDIFETVVG